MPLGAETLDYLSDVERIPCNHRIGEHGSAIEGMELITEFQPLQMCFLPKKRETGGAHVTPPQVLQLSYNSR